MLAVTHSGLNCSCPASPREMLGSLEADLSNVDTDEAAFVIAPFVALAGALAICAGVVALFSQRRQRRSLRGAEKKKSKPYARPKKPPEPVYFVDPDSGDLIEVDHASAEFKKLRGR